MSNTTYRRHPESHRQKNTKTSMSTGNSSNTALNYGIRIAQLVLHLLLIVLFYIAVIATFSTIGKTAYDFAYPIFGNVAVEATPGSDVEIVIEEGTDLREIAKMLADKKVVKNEYSFYIRSMLSINERRVIVPGSYKLNTSQDYGTILNILTRSDVIEK